MTDAWGIVDGYHDVAGDWHDTDPASAEACRRAMGEPVAGDPMEFQRHKRPLFLDRGALLVLEDGTELGPTAAAAGVAPLGYHQVRDPDGTSRPLTVVPDTAHRTAGRRWGWAVQVATLRDRAGWGTGDLGTVARLGRWASTTGATLLATSPMHAPLALTPRDPSPYFPSSRLWRDPALIRVDADPVRTTNREAIWTAKRAALHKEWSTISDRSRDRFETWRAGRGDALAWFALHEALVEVEGRPWTLWNEKLRTPSDASRATQTATHEDRVAFHAWLQWRLDAQLAEAGDSIGIISDLAIGVNPNGADAWRFQNLFAQGVRIGAPPDEFNQAGQDWGCAPFIPFALRAARYRPFIEAIRANLEHGAGLRMDHIMGLFRLYWIPPSASPRSGAYVTMPQSDLLDLVCLESVRAGADIVGEDLGTVDPQVREAMDDRLILGTRLVWFSDVPPSQFPNGCQASISTHDLPTVAGLMTGTDADERRSIGVSTDDAADAQLLSRLTRAAHEGNVNNAGPVETAVGALRALADGPAAIVLASMEDALGIQRRSNIPGTTTERLNWSLTLPVDVEDLAVQPGVLDTIAVMGARSGT